MNKKNKAAVKTGSVWSDNGLPEMEYCPLTRAAELLNVKIEDLLHFAEIGFIELCVKMDGFEAGLFSPMGYRDPASWEDFCENNVNVLLGFEVATKENGLSLFSPKYTPPVNFHNGKIAEKYFYEHNDTPGLRHPIIFLFGLWALTGMGDRHIFYKLSINGSINLNPLSFMLKEADYIPNPDSDDFYYAHPLREHLYGNSGLVKERIKTIVTLTCEDFYITRTQIDKIYSNIGKPISNLKNKNNSFEDKEHYTKIRARENRFKIHQAITKLLILHPHNPNDDSSNYRAADGRIIIAKVTRCLDYHAANLFDDKELPIKDESRLRAIISDYLENLGAKMDK